MCLSLRQAAAEPPWAHALAAGWRQLWHRLSGRPATGPGAHAGGDVPWWRMRFHAAAWQKALTSLGNVLDSLAALEVGGIRYAAAEVGGVRYAALEVGALSMLPKRWAC